MLDYGVIQEYSQYPKQNGLITETLLLSTCDSDYNLILYYLFIVRISDNRFPQIDERE